jgi:hypothetical protein
MSINKRNIAGLWALGHPHTRRTVTNAPDIKQKPGVASHPGEIGTIHEFQFPE